MTRLSQSLREVWSSELAARGDGHDAVERERIAEAVEVLHHELDAPSAVLAEPAQAVLERAIGRVEEVAEDVHVAPARLRVQLDRRDDPDADALALSDRLRHAGERVVVRERERLDAALGGEPHERGGLEDAIGPERMRVQVRVISRLAPHLGRRHATSMRRSTRTIPPARPLASSTSISTALNETGPSATRKRRGSPSRNRPRISSGLRPRTESRGPTMPMSLTNAVPFASTRASAVGTCVCVPTTAENFPSRNNPIATFSLVASACQSRTRTRGASPTSSSRRRSIAR